ncbi:MAG: hypothetical protein LBJ14_06600 [Desulfarculales bacterium]|jgi:hypothetical protein|nr:hypothetical protein [Desulfarculales bacterium]
MNRYICAKDTFWNGCLYSQGMEYRGPLSPPERYFDRAGNDEAPEPKPPARINAKGRKVSPDEVSALEHNGA